MKRVPKRTNINAITGVMSPMRTLWALVSPIFPPTLPCRFCRVRGFASTVDKSCNRLCGVLFSYNICLMASFVQYNCCAMIATGKGRLLLSLLMGLVPGPCQQLSLAIFSSLSNDLSFTCLGRKFVPERPMLMERGDFCREGSHQL